MKPLQTESPALSLCSPSEDLTCFRCCPPIRPHHYDCLNYVGSLRREFLDNRRFFLDHGPVHRPIVGFHCWALGFLDSRGRRVGCLLHPSRNGGRDLRSLIDYGEKCGRESCVPADMFALLPLRGQRFWLPLARGLSPFHFSSPRSNPLFHLLLWGPQILEPLRLLAEEKVWNETELLYHYPFLMGPAWTPKAHRYLFRLSLGIGGHNGESKDPVEIGNPGAHGGQSGRDAEEFAKELHRRILSLPYAQEPPEDPPSSSFTHSLPLEPDFLDFLRLDLGWQRAPLGQALEVKRELESLARSLRPHPDPRVPAGDSYQKV